MVQEAALRRLTVMVLAFDHLLGPHPGEARSAFSKDEPDKG